MYYIYHIPGEKIGCTSDLEKRMSDQGFTEWEILETHDDGWVAGDREKELQKEYGYPIDQNHYMIAVQNRRKWTKEDMSKGGRNSIQQMRSHLTKEILSKAGKAGKGKPKPRVNCKVCGKSVTPNTVNRFHNDNCKHRETNSSN